MSGYKDGYQRGQRDRRSLKAKDMRPPLGKAVLRGSKYVKDYAAGYKEGYRKGSK